MGSDSVLSIKQMADVLIHGALSLAVTLGILPCGFHLAVSRGHAIDYNEATMQPLKKDYHSLQEPK